MRLHFSLSGGLLAFITEPPDLAFVAAGVFFPATHAPEKDSAGFAARPPLVVLRLPTPAQSGRCIEMVSIVTGAIFARCGTISDSP